MRLSLGQSMPSQERNCSFSTGELALGSAVHVSFDESAASKEENVHIMSHLVGIDHNKTFFSQQLCYGRFAASNCKREVLNAEIVSLQPPQNSRPPQMPTARTDERGMFYTRICSQTAGLSRSGDLLHLARNVLGGVARRSLSTRNLRSGWCCQMRRTSFKRNSRGYFLSTVDGNTAVHIVDEICCLAGERGWRDCRTPFKRVSPQATCQERASTLCREVGG